MASTIQRMGILTGGGDCPGLNAVIRAAVKTAINEYDWEVLGIEDGFEGLIKPNKVRRSDIVDVRGLLPRGGTMLGSTNRANPFHYEVATAMARSRSWMSQRRCSSAPGTMALMHSWSSGAMARC